MAKKPLTAVVKVRLSPDQHSQIKTLAAKARRTVSDYIRLCLKVAR